MQIYIYISTLYYIHHLDMVTTTTTRWKPCYSLDLSCLLCAVCKSAKTDCRDISTLINHLDMATTTTTKLKPKHTLYYSLSLPQKSIPNEMLFGLRYFERPIANSPGGNSSKDAFSWGEVDMKSFAKCIISTCHSVREIVAGEPRLLKIDSPTYILGE